MELDDNINAIFFEVGESKISEKIDALEGEIQNKWKNEVKGERKSLILVLNPEIFENTLFK